MRMSYPKIWLLKYGAFPFLHLIFYLKPSKNMIQNTVAKSGSILVAEPFLLDSYFRRSVVLLTHHIDTMGSFGFIINRPFDDMFAANYLPIASDFKALLHYGGPVHTNRLYFLHGVGDLIPKSQEILKGVWLGGDFEVVKVLINQKLILPNQIRFYVGCSSWGEFQLSSEIKERTWIGADADANYVFSRQPKNLWRDVLVNKGDAYIIIGNMPDENYLN